MFSNNTNKQNVKQKVISLILKNLSFISILLTIFCVVGIIGYILIKGIPNLTLSLFSIKYNSINVSLLPALINTVVIIILTLLIAIPLGLGTAIYLVEYSKSESVFVKIIRLTTETLSGIPSIIYGIFGMLFFVTYFKFGLSILSGSLTLSIMILPLIIRTTEESLLAVPQMYRDGSYGLGAGKLRTIIKIVLPSSGSGILAGIILALGRIVGETAALIYTVGTIPQVTEGLFSSGRTLAIHMYILSCEGIYTDQAYATAVVLIIIVFAINTLSAFIAKKITTRS